MIFGRLEATKFGNRYKLLTVYNRHFILDLDSHPLFPIFPFLVFFIPVKAFEIDQLDVINTKPNQPSRFWILLAVVLTKQFSKYASRYSLPYLGEDLKRLVMIATIVLLFIVRYYFRMKKRIRTNTVNQISIRVRPNGLFVSFRVAVGFLLFNFLSFVSLYLAWTEGNLLWWIFFFYLSTMLNSLLMRTGEYKVKIFGKNYLIGD